MQSRRSIDDEHVAEVAKLKNKQTFAIFRKYEVFNFRAIFIIEIGRVAKFFMVTVYGTTWRSYIYMYRLDTMILVFRQKWPIFKTFGFAGCDHPRHEKWTSSGQLNCHLFNVYGILDSTSDR